MQAIDFSRTYLTFRGDFLKKPPTTASHKPPYTLNNARIQIDSRCEITERSTGWKDEYLLGASCKTERVGVERDIWLEPNADFIPVHSRTQFINIKTYERAGMQVPLYPPSLGMQPERQTGISAEVFDSTRLDVMWVEAELMATSQDIVNATLANYPLMARTTIENERYTAVIDFPIKTMNANERDWIYQTDTGPVLLPDLTREPADLIAGFELAFAAFNCPTWVEFIVRTPTEIAPGMSVYHYSKSVRFDSKNEVMRLR